MDTKFSVAVHVLILISESPTPMHSEQMAQSVGTNASYIRKILSLLKKANILDGKQGVGGYSLTVSPKQLSLLRIYQATVDNAEIHLFDLHRNPNDECTVGRHITPVLHDMFESVENAFQQSLSEKTLDDCIADIRKRM